MENRKEFVEKRWDKLIRREKTEEAIPILTQLFEDNPTALRYRVRLSNCYLRIGEIALARDTVQKIRKTQKEPMAGLYTMFGDFTPLGFLRRIQKNAQFR